MFFIINQAQSAISTTNNELSILNEKWKSPGKGGDINIQDNIGFTPLMEAITRNNKVAIDALLQNSADLDLFDKRDRTAADLAKAVKCEHFASKTSHRRTLLNSAL